MPGSTAALAVQGPDVFVGLHSCSSSTRTSMHEFSQLQVTVQGHNKKVILLIAALTYIPILFFAIEKSPYLKSI